MIYLHRFLSKPLFCTKFTLKIIYSNHYSGRTIIEKTGSAHYIFSHETKLVEMARPEFCVKTRELLTIEH